MPAKDYGIEKKTLWKGIRKSMRIAAEDATGHSTPVGVYIVSHTIGRLSGAIFAQAAFCVSAIFAILAAEYESQS